jgi:ribosomal protein S18 acetylase RimI-like enzyme
MVEIEQVTSANADLLRNVAAEVFDLPVDPARLAKYAASAGHLMLVAREGALVIGQIAAVIHRHPDKPTELYIDELGVAPPWQRQGIGRRLLEAMLELGRAQGCEEVWVGTEPHNVAANTLYGARAKGELFVMYVWDV